MKFTDFLNEKKETIIETIKLLNFEATFEFDKEPKYNIFTKTKLDTFNNATMAVRELDLPNKYEIKSIEDNSITFNNKSGIEIVNGTLIKLKIDDKNHVVNGTLEDNLKGA